MKYFYFLLLILFAQNTFAQQASIYTQAADGFGLINPAGLTLEEMRLRGTTISTFLRNQWWNSEVEGKPQTQVISALFNPSKLNHFGAMIVADKIGETREIGLSLRYAHALGENLKIGIGLGMLSNRISVNKLDQFDESDPVAMAAAENRWRYTANLGAFYNNLDENLPLGFFIGIAAQHQFYNNSLSENTKTQAETHLLAHGGIRFSKIWWLTGRIRLSMNQPNALDLYLRKYLTNNKDLFAAIIFTSTQNYQTTGIQAGYEWKLKSTGFDDKQRLNNHILIASLAFSKPLSNYIEGSNLIFDARITWVWDRRKRGF